MAEPRLPFDDREPQLAPAFTRFKPRRWPIRRYPTERGRFAISGVCSCGIDAGLEFSTEALAREAEARLWPDGPVCDLCLKRAGIEPVMDDRPTCTRCQKKLWSWSLDDWENRICAGCRGEMKVPGVRPLMAICGARSDRRTGDLAPIAGDPSAARPEPSEPGPFFLCSREKDHSGPHEAWGGGVLWERWS